MIAQLLTNYETFCVKFPSFCLWMGPVCGHNFLKSYQIWTQFDGCLLCIKCSSGIEIQSKIQILILIKISILTKTLQNEIKFDIYLFHIEDNFLVLNFIVKSWSYLCKKKFAEKSLRNKTQFQEYL